MNVAYLIGGVVSSILTVGHAYFGEALFFKGIPDSTYPTTYWGDGDITKRLMKGAWHFLTVSLGVAGVSLLLLSFTSYFEQPAIIANLIFWEFVGYAIVFIYYAIGRPAIIFRAPLLFALAAVAICSWIGPTLAS